MLELVDNFTKSDGPLISEIFEMVYETIPFIQVTIKNTALILELSAKIVAIYYHRNFLCRVKSVLPLKTKIIRFIKKKGHPGLPLTMET